MPLTLPYPFPLRKQKFRIPIAVDNYRRLHPSESVSGMLLYARTDAEVQPDSSIPLADVHLEIRSLDLNGDFRQISGQLDNIALSMRAEKT